MTDKEFDKQKARVQKYIDKWFTTLGMGWFTIDFEWTRETDGGTAGRTTSQWQYRSATITFFLSILAEHDDDTVERTVVHEMAHVLLSGIAQNMIHDDETLSNQVNEYTTETVTAALMWARLAGEDQLKKRKTK
jgi:predicted SprT family Zn-dependent metalloprotease